MDGSPGYSISFCQLTQALPVLAITKDGVAIELKRLRPMCRPSRWARRMPARTRSTIRLRSSSATAR